MIFIKDKGSRFGYSNKAFLNTPIFNSASVIGTFINDGYMGPTNCGAVSTNKNLAQKKAFSESLERRALALNYGNIKENNNMIHAFDLIQNKPTLIPECLTKYSLVEPFVDTTGTATHRNPLKAKINAISELLEKNAIFLFWYGKKFVRYNEKVDSIYKDHLINQGYSVYFFLVTEFFPLQVVITIAYSEFNPLKFKFGIGSSLSLIKAIEKSLSETYLLGSYYEIKYYDKLKGYVSNDNEIDIFFNPDILEYLKSILDAPVEHVGNSYLSLNEDYPDYYLHLPNWIKSLKIMILPQLIKKELVVVKVISDELYNHVPKKNYLDLNRVINRRTICLTEEKLAIIPECPIV
ncbi:YcaO-like family protein [Bacillus sp. Bva_UNVM-123]|uniref:YcaO-like family protein n=1 Tax=Bacillus sp. Bva_UNVM-123 TaxID=2829798 RepID=UPI00391F3F28